MEPRRMTESITRLFALLEVRGIPYMLVGGIAMLHHVEGRNTQDVDLVLDADSLKLVPELELSSQDLYFARGAFEGLPVDILLTRNPVFHEVRERFATTLVVEGLEVTSATVEGLIALKLYALPSLYRQGDFVRVGLYENDIATLLQHYEVDVAPLLELLGRHMSQSDIDALNEIVSEIMGRLARFRRGIGPS